MNSQLNQLDIYYEVDRFVSELEEDGYPLEDILASMREFVEITEEINGAAGL